jgi:hypothetical protein
MSDRDDVGGPRPIVQLGQDVINKIAAAEVSHPWFPYTRCATLQALLRLGITSAARRETCLGRLDLSATSIPPAVHAPYPIPHSLCLNPTLCFYTL